MNIVFKTVIVIILILLLQTNAVAEPIAIIVHKDNPDSEMSYKDLIRTFRGYASRWKDGQKILLVHSNLNSTTRVDFYRKVMDAQSNKDIPGAKPDIATVIIEIPSDEALLNFISVTPNAIGYIYAHKTSDAVKILKIDNYLPNESGYPIK